MKLDATDLRYITSEEFRVLTAVEMGSKNHEIIPTPLIVQISGLRGGGVNKILGSLAKRNLVARVRNSRYDGYRLTYGGYDYLAMRALSKRDSMYSVGNQIGVGKESDIYIVADEEHNDMVLKLHRLGRISFRAIKEKRDYMGKRKSASWMYMSRLAAQKEWAFMKILHEHGFPVPKPVDQARHCILMEFIDAYPLRQVSDVESPGALYSELMDLIVRFARAGLIHGDFNEFNILIRRESGKPVVIDFPQMVSTSHENAEWYFNRDVECIRTFFRRRFQYESNLYPRFRSTLKDGLVDGDEGFRLDVIVAASGFKNSDQKLLEQYLETAKEQPNSEEEDDDSEDNDSEEVRQEEEGEEDVDQEYQALRNPLGKEVEQEDVEDKAEFNDERTEVKPDNSNVVPPNSNSPQNGELSPPISSRALSRSPPASRHASRSPSPTHLEEQIGSLSISHRTADSLKEKAMSEVARHRSKQQRKYHSKKGAQRDGGRQRGSKAKMDTRVKVDRSGVWE